MKGIDMVSTVIVPLDGSELAESALTPAQEVATRFGASLLLFRATWSEEDESQRYLDDIAAKIDLPTTTVVGKGFAAPALGPLLDEHPDAVVCMTTHGRTGVSAVFLGGTAEELLRMTVAPALLVGPTNGPDALAPGGDRILALAFDGSEEVAALVPTAAEWARRLEMGVRVVTVLHRNGEFLGNHPSGPVKARAAELVEQLQGLGLEAATDFPDHVEPAHGLVHYATENPVALIVAGRKKPRGLTGAVLGSVALRVVRHGSVPVLVM
jgi:nucleotide-binding universal stress UspA family protein